MKLHHSFYPLTVTAITTLTTWPIAPTPVPQLTLPLTPPPGYTPGAYVGSRSPSPAAKTQRECLVVPLGWGQDDSPQLNAAALECGTDGTITMPAPYVYSINTRLYMKLVRARLDVLGTLSFNPNIAYWTAESHRIEFQNTSTAWIIEGQDYVISGGGWRKGGINGNGQAWYSYAHGQDNLYGRPISMTIYNSTNVTVEEFSIIDAQFWAIYLQDSYNVTLQTLYINSTNTDPYGNQSNYITNTDGLDSIRTDGLVLQNWLFSGGDDCVAPKGNSTNMTFRNLTCSGGGIAFGSVGQYENAPDYIFNVVATDISVTSIWNSIFGGANVSAGAYFKSWIGESFGTPPQGGGGGSGRVSNITFSRLTVQNTSEAVRVNQCYYKEAAAAAYCNTSKIQFENMAFSRLHGSVQSSLGIDLNCSAATPCKSIKFRNVNLAVESSGAKAGVACIDAQNIKGINCTA